MKHLKYGFTPQDSHREIAEKQRAHLRRAADRIERGESLDGLYVPLIAYALRALADRIPDEPKRRPGRAAQVDPYGLALRYAMSGMSQERLAEEAGISVPALRKAIKKAGNLDVFRPALKTRKTK